MHQWFEASFVAEQIPVHQNTPLWLPHNGSDMSDRMNHSFSDEVALPFTEER